MMLKWEGEGPPDKDAWYDVLSEALGAEAGFYWVRFYREGGGWRFDLECRKASGPGESSLKRADINVALHVYALLVENGMPLDPGWRPTAPSPPVTRVRRAAAVVAPPPPLSTQPQPAAPTDAVPLPLAPAEPSVAPAEPADAPGESSVAPAEPSVAQAESSVAPNESSVATAEPADAQAEPADSPASQPVAENQAPVTQAAPAPSAEVSPAPPAEGPHPTGRRRRGRRRGKRGFAPPEPVREAEAEPVAATTVAATPVPEPTSEPEPQLAPPPRPSGGRSFRPAIPSLFVVLVVAVAAWLLRDRLPSRPAAQPAASPSGAASPAPVTAQERSAQLATVATQPPEQRAEAFPRRAPTAPARVASTPPPSERLVARPAERRTGRLPPPVAAATPTPTPAPTPAPAEPPVSTDAAVTAGPVPSAAAEPPPTPPPTPSPAPVQRGALVDVSDPDLTRPVVVSQTPARYPPVAFQRRIAGSVLLTALVDETGAVTEVSLVRATPAGHGFEDSATRFVRTRVYQPATKRGVPVRVWLPITVEFRPPER